MISFMYGVSSAMYVVLERLILYTGGIFCNVYGPVIADFLCGVHFCVAEQSWNE